MASKDDFINFFKAADVDKSGYLTTDEVMHQLRIHGYKGNDDILKKYFSKAELVQNSQKLTLEQFVNSMSQAPPQIHRAALMRRVFAKFDRNGDGTLDRKELKRATAVLGDKFTDDEIDTLMQVLDRDGSDSIDMEEFIVAFLNKRG